MNILFFTQFFYPVVFGGGEYIFYLLAKELVKRGHGVRIITQRMNNTTEFEIVEGIKIYRVGSELLYSGALPQTIRHNLAYLIYSIVKGREIMNDQRPDIVHSNTYIPALSGQLCSKLYHVPHIVTFHDVYQASDNQFWNKWSSKRHGKGTPFYASLLSSKVERFIMKLNVSAFHTVSDTSKADLIRFGVKKNIHVIPNGIDPALYDVVSAVGPQHSDGPSAVFVGRLVFYKNVETLIRAFRKVLHKFPNAKLVILGDGPHKDSLVEEAQEIRESVLFAGRVSHSDKIAYIAEASCMVFPSLIEGFGIAIIEGFACHKPVLVSDVRPLSDIVKDNRTGYVISPFDVDAWAERIIDLFGNIAKQQVMGENAFREFLSHYRIGNVASSMESVYCSLTSKKL